MAGDSKVPMGHPDHVSERTIAITGGDAGYFDLMKDCIGSLRATPEGSALSLGILDCGLTEEQRAWCRAQGATLVVPQWDFEFPGRDRLKDGYKALTARPFLPRYFPGFELYFWIDADCWVQQGDAIALFLAAARTGALAVAPEIHRSMRHYHHAWGEFSAVCGAAYEACFDKATAERLIRYPMINAGVFALRTEAPHWSGWARIYGAALQRSHRSVGVERPGLRQGFWARAAAQPLQLAGPSCDAGLGRRTQAVCRAGHAL
jgi:hypothetical protein